MADLIEHAINSEGIVRDVIVLGGSAGSYQAIVDILGSLPAGLPAIVGVVLHRGAQSSRDWSVSLGRKAVIDVREGKHGTMLYNGSAYIAPSDHHMMFQAGLVRLDGGPKQHFTRPAVNPLFKSAAAQYGTRVVGVVLSGCGADGSDGLRAISEAGGVSLIQKPSEAEAPSMPKHAARYDHVQASLSVDDIAGVLVALAHGAKVAPTKSERIPIS
jgi:two-component system, chemotaxis family, protein-glutamate methylesterase/glutaminase